ncbi:MAG: hypothetical protein MR383_00300 [Lachnospiraceae bacterium]|nr:hypothetical protein [Lachnospiraceae bacterium]MDD7026548.1 hypothetical protein [Lachnospiraceae bacterium]
MNCLRPFLQKSDIKRPKQDIVYTKLTVWDKLNALTSLYFNGSRPANKDSLFSKLIALEIRGEGQKELSEEEKQKEAVELLHEAEEKNWYGENQGLVRRRLMEVNIYFNHDYTCYDSLEIEELKDMVGY